MAVSWRRIDITRIKFQDEWNDLVGYETILAGVTKEQI